MEALFVRNLSRPTVIFLRHVTLRHSWEQLPAFFENRGLRFLKYEDWGYETLKYEDVKTQEYKNS